MTTTNPTSQWAPEAQSPATTTALGGEYAKLDLCGLFKRIVNDDRRALEVLVTDRRPLLLRQQPVSIPEWIEAMYQAQVTRSSGGGGDEVAEIARDQLYDRLTHLPDNTNQSHCDVDSASPCAKARVQSTSHSAAHTGAYSGGSDCRNYYAAFLKHLPACLKRLSGSTELTPLEYNRQVHQCFNGFVHRHWRLCVREAWRRIQRLTVAYEYDADGVLMRLGVPASIPPAARAQWIANNFGPIDVDADGVSTTQYRLQCQIDEWLDQALRERERGLRFSVQQDRFGAPHTPESIEQGWTHQGLAQTVAYEKAHTPGRLRTSIAALGREQINALVLGIFEDLINGTYHPATTARAYGLHRSTMTRFAAARWRPGDDGPVPDLWLNTAQVLASQPRFVKALEEAGLEELVDALGHRKP